MSDTLRPPSEFVGALCISVAGTSGGVGVTTLTALLSDGLGARTGRPPRVFDHSGGGIAGRLRTASSSGESSVRDIGLHATALASASLSGSDRVVIVAGPDDDSADTALFALQRMTSVSEDHEAMMRTWERRSLIVINSISVRRDPRPVADRLAQSAPGAGIIALPWDEALSLPGPVDHESVTPATVAVVASILQAFGVA